MSELKVSIFTPTNNSAFLEGAYDSIKDQDFYEWVVVYNNGGVPVEFKDPRVKEHILWNAPAWIGPLKAFACEQCTGDILVELDHDDLLMPNAIEEIRAAFEDPEIGFVYSNTIHSTGDFQPIKRFSELYGWHYRVHEINGNILDEAISFPPTPDSVSRIWFAPNHVRAFRKTAYDEVGGYSKDMRVLDDVDLMCRMYLKTKFKHIDKGLYLYRVHGENSWLRYNAEVQENVYRMYDKYIADLVWRWADLEGLRKIDLGGRFNSPAGYETVDLKDADVIADLNGDWPFEDSSIGVIRAHDFFEHLRDPIHTMKEAYRVLAPRGWVLSLTPSTDGRGAWQDPTHVSFWNENSFHYYAGALSKFIDTPVRFQAPRLFTTPKDQQQVCWVVAHLVCLKGGFRPAGLIEI
jgi:glycosyltransferase involved in cell wall biosynthesis